MNNDNSYCIISESNDDFDDEYYNIDESCDELQIQRNTPEKYVLKKDEIELLLGNCKKEKNSKNVKILERHLTKLLESEKKNVLFEEFEKSMIITAKNDKNMNPILKKLYLK